MKSKEAVEFEECRSLAGLMTMALDDLEKVVEADVVGVYMGSWMELPPKTDWYELDMDPDEDVDPCSVCLAGACLLERGMVPSKAGAIEALEMGDLKKVVSLSLIHI